MVIFFFNFVTFLLLNIVVIKAQIFIKSYIFYKLSHLLNLYNFS